MPYLFEHLSRIEEALNFRPFGLITDVDGTISEIAPSPEAAIVSPLCRYALASLAQRLALVACISGRPAEEVKEMVGVEGIVYVGNHGLERWAKGRVELWESAWDYPIRIAAVLDKLSSLLNIEGITLENKGITASIHYRRCQNTEAARKAILSAVASLAVSGLRVSEGRRVVELRPAIDISKGTALLDLMEKYGLRGAIYLGDDITDVDAFLALRQARCISKGISVAVASQEMPPQLEHEADLTLNGLADVERFLLWLVEALAKPGS